MFNNILKKFRRPLLNQPKPRNLRWLLITNSTIITLLLSGLYLWSPQFIEHLDLKATDTLVKATQATPISTEVVTVNIDETSLKEYGQWPWSRYRIAQLLQKIQQNGAKSIGVDILFPEADRTSPKTWQDMIKKDFGFSVDTSHLPNAIIDYDNYLAKVLSSGPFILGYEFLFDTTGKPKIECALQSISVNRLSHSYLKELQVSFHRAKTAICNYKPLTQATSHSGFFNGTPDFDGIIRRLPLVMEFDGKYYPSFALAVLLQHTKDPLLFLQTDGTAIPYLSFGNKHIPLDTQGNYYLGPVLQSTSSHFSASDILAGKVESNTLKGKIVLVGLSASGLKQNYPTRYTQDNSLLDLHKYAIESLSSQFQTVQTPFSLILIVGLSLILCNILAFAISRLTFLWTTAIALITLCICWLGAASIYQNSGYLFSPLLPTTVIAFTFGLLNFQKVNHYKKLAKAETGGALMLMRSSQNELESILKTIPDIIFRLDTHDKIIFISPAIHKYIEPTGSLLGKSIFDLVPPEELPKVQHKLTERRTGKRATFDLEICLQLDFKDQPPSETTRFFSISTEGIYNRNPPNTNRFIGTQGIIRDITDRKKLEIQLIQAQKMEVLGNLAAGIAHDLNNILSGLVSYPDLLLLEIPKESPLYQKITIIQKSGKKAATIVQDLLTLARRNVTINEICNINDIIRDYLDSVEFQRLQSRYTETTIHTDLQKSLMNVKGSAVHLSKIIMNIIHNGLEAMPAGGSISILTSNIFLDSAWEGYETIPEGEYVCLTISDDGVGIPHSDLHRIFEPFFTKKTLAKSGTGLGMTIIWATIKDHNGYIDILSKEGIGTTFKIYLPITRESLTLSDRKIVLDNYIGSETLLVVDDISEQLDIASNMLSKLGYKIVTASSGEEALVIIKKQSIDLVILDMIMPSGFDGMETYMEMIKISPKQKAIITSGFSESEQVKKLQQLGVESYVQKPYSMEKIAMAVRKELDK